MPTEINGSPDDAFMAATDVAVIEEPTDTVVDPEPEEVELTDEQKAQQEWLDAESAWKTRFDEAWEYERFEYKGDNLAVRKPKMQSLAAFQLASSKFIDDERRNDITGLFVDQHVGRESYDHMMRRLMDPDDPDYTTASISDVMGGLVSMAVADIKAEAEADAKKVRDQKGLRAVQ